MTLNSHFPARHKLSTKIAGALVSFLLLALIVIGVTLLLSWQLEGSSAAINETGSLRMHSYRLTLLVTRAVDKPGQPSLRAAAEQEMQAIDSTFNLLAHSDPQRPLALPPTDSIRTTFASLSKRWRYGMRPLAVASLGAGTESAAAWQKYQAEVERFVFDIDRLVHAIERDSEWRTFWLRSSQLALVAMALTGTVALIYLMFMLIVEPVTRLSEGMKSMADQDLSVRLPVESKDEFGQLTIGFNQMADRLQALYDSLEDRVRKKTAALADQNCELALLYDSASFLQLPQSLESMCDGFLQRIRTYFGADGSSVRVLDPRNSNLHMVVHHGISQELVETERCLKVGDCLCGDAVAKKITVIHDLRKMDEAHHLQCHREGFATVSVFHIHVHNQHLGFFNLHFRTAKTFSEHEQALLETLGQLLGIAIENLRLATREREMAISEERNLVAQGLHDSIAQGLTFLNIQVQMLEDSLRYGRVDEATAIVPVLRAGVQESYEDVRELLLNFRSRLSEDDLIGAIKGTLDKFKRQTGIEAELIAKGNGAPFPREQQLQVLFIVQEALSNIRKHALASKVEVKLDDSQDFTLSISDNGVGFDPAGLAQRGDNHVGLNIMQERAHRIHAILDVNSAPGKGTTVLLRLLREHRRAA
ncbi:MAG: type IV pili methyl-accepting chemotaxis transducer N-terminal domain-containing protein [Burkholderiales bacterium]|nr:type IV pili methyl-accepting chemotaxis transducer N-terminal domain-containing protein [Burkholderiales bacterium]